MFRFGFMFVMAMATATNFAATRTVDLNGSGQFLDIQSGINAAVPGDTVLVEPGEYLIVEPVTFKGKPITVRSRAGPEATAIRMAILPVNPDRGTVLNFLNGENASSVMEGFTIIGGSGSMVEAPSWWFSPTVIGGGGVLARANSSPTLRNCRIVENRASLGAGVWCSEGARPTLIDCAISGNYGGGAYFQDSSPTLTNCVIAMNQLEGGGLYQAGGVGGYRSSLVASNCRIQGNAGNGVSVTCEDGTCAPSLSNCLIQGNQQNGLFSDHSRTAAVNCTMVGNQGYGLRSEGGPIADAVPRLTSCILWNNAGGSVATLAGGEPKIGFSCVEREAVWPGSGNINDDPRFCGWGGAEVYVDSSQTPGSGTEDDPFSSIDQALAQEFHLSLRADSPCLGTGSSATDMGAGLGTCAIAEPTDLTIHLAMGSYVDGELKLPTHGRVSLQGAGMESTYINGTISGLREGAVISALTVSNGRGVIIAPGQAGEIRNCSITGYTAGVTCQGFGASATVVNCDLVRNTGPGVLCSGSASVTVRNCTLSGNQGGGVACTINSTAAVTASIIWSNPGGPILKDESSTVSVEFSCLDSTPVWSGTGNLNADPRFCGRAAAAEVYVDAAHFGTGSGTISDPYSSLADAISGEFLLSLRPNSPCRGAGPGHQDIGADRGTCVVGGAESLIVHLAGGRYGVGELALPAEGVIRIEGAGRDATIIDGTITGLRTGVLLARLSVVNGSGLVVAKGAPEIRDCQVSENSGGVICRGPGSRASIINCLIKGNSGSGVSCLAGSTATLAHCTITGNTGGGLACTGSSALDLTNCIVWRNPAGAVMRDDSSAFTAKYSCIDADPAWPGEGNINANPVFCGFFSAPEVYVDASTIGNHLGTQEEPYFSPTEALNVVYRFSLKPASPCRGSGMGGADMGADLGICPDEGAEALLVHLAPGKYSVGDLSLPLDGLVSLQGGGPALTIIEGTIQGLRTGIMISGMSVIHGFGFFVKAGAAPEIRDTTLSRNAVGLACQGAGASPTLVNCSLTGNWGLGVSSFGHSSPHLINCTISNNLQGGVLTSDSSARLDRCIILGNAASYGGGIFCTGTSTPVVTNCIIAGNLATNGGGGVASTDIASPILMNCTIAQNMSDRGGGAMVCYSQIPPRITNCIAWGNFPDDFLCGADLNSIVDQDPLFVRAGAFEFDLFRCETAAGPCAPAFLKVTPDYHLRTGSPGIDGGESSGAPTEDYEGNRRFCGAEVDIGAYEFGDCFNPQARFVRGDANDDQRVDISDASACLGFLYLGNPSVLDCQKSADLDSNGALEISDPIYLLTYQFLGGPAPGLPFPGCGAAAVLDALPCDRFNACSGQGP